MSLTRRSKYGFPPNDAPPSQQTVRLVPLTTGNKSDTAWPMMPPGSAQSMTNFLPLDGVLVPRSRLSSLNTIRTLPTSPTGMAECLRADGVVPHSAIWCSTATAHGILTSNGSMSMASGVSTFGGAPDPTISSAYWNYAQIYSADLNENMLIAAARASTQTLLCLYQLNGGSLGKALSSYLTSAPKAATVASFDNYLIAWNITDPVEGAFATRAQWCQRGSPSNWTGEGSGFEDLLQARGAGTAIFGLEDGRVILFTSVEIWYGTSAAYPAQFQFAPLDASVGCAIPRTIAQTDLGLVFVGSDHFLRVLPRGGGTSQIIVPGVGPYLRQNVLLAPNQSNWATYDARTKIYYLFLPNSALAINIATGEWGFLAYDSSSPMSTGMGVASVSAFDGSEGMFFANSFSTFFSTNSLLQNDSSIFTTTSTWRSSVIGSDLPGSYKQLTDLQIDYRATSGSTVTLRISQDGGNTYETTGVPVSLPVAPVTGRAQVQTYNGGAFPTVEIVSTSTGYELHRMDGTLNIGGRR